MRKIFSIVSLLAAFGTIAEAELATVYLADGNAATVELVAVDRGQVQWKANMAPNTPVESYFRSQIAYVDFPTTESWREAEEAYESGKFTEAIKLYGSVITDKESHFYPIPGNFVSLALVRILECHRANLDPAAVAKQAAVVRGEFLNLPPGMRNFSPTIQAWIAVSGKKWEEALQILGDLELPGPESFFLKGIALENLGKLEEAVQEYSGAYVLNFGGSTKLTKEALQRSLNLLAQQRDENRTGELQAQAKIYRDLFGGGQLWSEAPEWLVELADGEIATTNADISGEFDADSPPPAGKMEDEGTVVTESAASAAIEPLEERDFILVSELERKFYIMGKDPDTYELTLDGGVTEVEEGYKFDGSGGAVVMGGLGGNQKLVKISTRFTPETLDCVVFDSDVPKRGGIGLYIVEGELIFVWDTLGRIKPVSSRLGEITANQRYDLNITVSPNGKMIAFLNGERADANVQRNGLRIKGAMVVSVGDTTVGDNPASADGKTHPPFQGVIQYFAIGSGPDGAALVEGVKKHNGGKSVRFTAPPVETVAPEEPAAPEEPEAAPPAEDAPPAE